MKVESIWMDEEMTAAMAAAMEHLGDSGKTPEEKAREVLGEYVAKGVHVGADRRREAFRAAKAEKAAQVAATEAAAPHDVVLSQTLTLDKALIDALLPVLEAQGTNWEQFCVDVLAQDLASPTACLAPPPPANLPCVLCEVGVFVMRENFDPQGENVAAWEDLAARAIEAAAARYIFRVSEVDQEKVARCAARHDKLRTHAARRWVNVSREDRKETMTALDQYNTLTGGAVGLTLEA